MTIALQSLAGLSLDEKRRLLARLLREKAERSAAVFPLSHGQRGLWFLHQMDPHSSCPSENYPLSRTASRTLVILSIVSILLCGVSRTFLEFN